MELWVVDDDVGRDDINRRTGRRLAASICIMETVLYGGYFFVEAAVLTVLSVKLKGVGLAVEGNGRSCVL